MLLKHPIVAAIAAAWPVRATLLRTADLWIVSDPVVSADAVVVLGGGIATRAFAASEYYRKGLVSRVLISNWRRGKEEELGIVPAPVTLTRSLLLRLDVPESAIEELGSELSSTYEESVALRAWALRTHARSVLVPTEIFSTRRVRWIFHRELAGTGTLVSVPALQPQEYDHRNWWKHEEGLVAFQNEVIKYLYYRIKY